VLNAVLHDDGTPNFLPYENQTTTSPHTSPHITYYYTDSCESTEPYKIQFCIFVLGLSHTQQSLYRLLPHRLEVMSRLRPTILSTSCVNTLDYAINRTAALLLWLIAVAVSR